MINKLLKTSKSHIFFQGNAKFAGAGFFLAYTHLKEVL